MLYKNKILGLILILPFLSLLLGIDLFHAGISADIALISGFLLAIVFETFAFGLFLLIK